MKNLFITDLDGTLTKKSLVLGHAGFLIEEGIMEDTGIYQAWKEDMKNEKLIVALAEEYRHQIKGKTVKELQVADFVADFLADDKNWYSTLEMLTTAKNFGDDVILITGSSDFIVCELAEQLGFDWYATKYHLDKTGKLNGEITGMFSETQKSEVIEKYIDLHLYNEVIGLGDTSSDYGIFKHCNFNYLVDPTQETLERLILKGCKIDKIIKK